MLTLCRRVAAIGFPTTSVDGPKLRPIPARRWSTTQEDKPDASRTAPFNSNSITYLPFPGRLLKPVRAPLSLRHVAVEDQPIRSQGGKHPQQIFVGW
jgi:hypothetical protein